MTKSLHIAVGSLVLVTALTACNRDAHYTPEEQAGNNPPLPGAKNFLLPPIYVPQRIGWQDGSTPKVAEGLKITRIGGDFEHPRNVLALPNGDILVVESQSPGEEAITTPKQLVKGFVTARAGKGGKGGNRISLLRRQADGHYQKYTYLDHLNSPFGVKLIGDELYVAEVDHIDRYHYRADETRMSSPAEYVTDLPSTIQHHWTKTLAVSPDQKKLYVGVGSNSNVGENGLEVEYRRANILEVYLDTRSSRIYASGIRNPSGLAVNPSTHQLWAVANERDEIGSDLVPDYLTSVQDGGFYGWPYSYYGQHVDTRVKKQRPDLVNKAIVPDYALGSHVAPLGVHFSTGKGLPEHYASGAFVSEHGSWDRTPLSGYQVVFVPFHQGKPSGAPQPVVTGFLSDNQSHLHGAPVGLDQTSDGSLVVADDVGNAVWLIQPDQ